MATPVPISPEDIAESEDIDFQETEEHWNVYKLKDGTTLKVKLIVSWSEETQETQP